MVENKLKSFELIALGEDISIQPSIDSVVWLLIITLMQIYIKKTQARQREI